MAINDSTTYYKLNEASGSRADSAGSATLTDNNTVASAQGRVDIAADFENGNAEWLSGTPPSIWASAADKAVSLWIYVESFTAASADYTGIMTVGKANNVIWNIALTSNSVNNNRLKLEVQNSGASYQAATYGTDLSASTWYHIVAELNSGTLRLYLNGTNVAEQAFTGSIKTDDGTFTLTIGRDLFNDAAVRYFDGLIDEVAVFNHGVTSADVLRLYNGGAGITYPHLSSSIYRIAASVNYAQYASSASARTLQYGGNLTPGTLLVVRVSFANVTNNNGMDVTVSDDVNGAYTQAGTTSADPDGFQHSAIFYFAGNGSSGKPTVTVTPNQTGWITIVVDEYYGADITTPLRDADKVGDISSSAVLPSVTAVAGDLVLAVTGESSTSPTTTVPDPFAETVDQIAVSGSGIHCADDYNAAGDEGVTFTYSGVARFGANIASFKPASSNPVIEDEAGLIYTFIMRW